MVESSHLSATLGEDCFSRMTKRGMANVVHQGQRFDQVFVEAEFSPDGPGDRSNFQRVRQPRTVVVSQLAGEDLRLVG
jgi:hypothetical protein